MCKSPKNAKILDCETEKQFSQYIRLCSRQLIRKHILSRLRNIANAMEHGSNASFQPTCLEDRVPIQFIGLGDSSSAYKAAENNFREDRVTIEITTILIVIVQGKLSVHLATIHPRSCHAATGVGSTPAKRQCVLREKES